MNKRYQVFISSTYSDLIEERRYVMQALMEMDCIPAGMELFPAADEEQWEFIKKIIDECDYYLLVIGGRYGSISADGISYTEKEYDYAVEKGIRVICLIHKNPDTIPLGKSENDPEKKIRLTAFCDKVKTGRMVKFWEKPEELQMLTVSSLNHAIRNYPAIGFVRANLVPDESSLAEINKLRNKISELEAQLTYISTNAPSGTEELAQGDDFFELKYKYSITRKIDPFNISFADYTPEWKNATLTLSWNVIFSDIAPFMVNEASEETLQNQMNHLISCYNDFSSKKEFSGKIISDFTVDTRDFQKIKIQLRSLGLIIKNIKNRSVKDTDTYWTLTPYGDMVMTRLIAIKRNV